MTLDRDEVASTVAQESTATRASDSATPHDWITRLLHWATAILVVSLYVFYLVWERMPKGDNRHLVIVAHMSFGILLTAVLIARIAWHLSPRSTPQSRGGVTDGLAHVVHLGLYGLLILQVASGWNFRWAQNQSLSLFGLLIPSPFSYPAAARHTLAVVHYWAGTGVVALAGLHALAALTHHYLLRDGVMRRMLPAPVGQLRP